MLYIDYWFRLYNPRRLGGLCEVDKRAVSDIEV